MMTPEQLRGINRARILINATPVGYLEMLAQDEYRFSYDEEYLAAPNNLPLSLSLPLSRRQTVYESLPPFFDNLLMEGRNIRRLSKTHGLDARVRIDRFRLLMLCSQDVIGAVHIQPLLANGEPAEIQKEVSRHPLEFETLELKSAYRDRCPMCLEPSSIHPACSMKLAGTKSPLRIEVMAEAKESTFRMLPAGSSISGVQDKNLFRVKNGVFTPRNPSTHIIKPEGDYPEMPANEHLTMTIARRLKFKVPPTGLFEVDGLGLVYVIKRFDRISKESKVLLEDFAQILAFMEDDKEEGSFEDIASAIECYCNSPIIEKSELFRRLLFCFVFGNGDIHLKNWSLIYESSKRLYKLSPIYDWLNVRASMPEEKVESVLPISGKRSDFTRKDFEGFARDRLKIGNNFITACFDEVPKWLELAQALCPESALSEKMKARYMKVVEERAWRVLGRD